MATIHKIHEIFLDLYKIPFNKKNLETQLNSIYQNETTGNDAYLNILFESGTVAHLTYFKNWMSKEEFFYQLENIHFPILIFTQENHEYVPQVLMKENGKIIKYIPTQLDTILKQIFNSEDATTILKGKSFTNLPENQEKLLVITCFPNNPVFSQDSNSEGIATKLKTIQRFFRILKSEKREIGYIYIYAIISGFIGLSLPLGVQSIIGFVSSGHISTSVIVLISFIVVGIFITGGLQVMQLSLVEHIQQRLFTRTAFEFAFRIPKLKIESVMKYYPPELMNRFFDIITLQKGLAKILIEFSAAFLQIILGLLLLSLYHASFIFFGFFLVGVLVLILRATGPKGLDTSLKESKYKYMVANWLEEVAKSLSTFKLAGYSNLPMEKTDYFVSNYLHARKSHFKVLITQYFSFVAFKTLITGGLLILGCILLIDKQINIGQFVASEIIIILIMNAVEKIIIQLDTVYDVLTSIEKIGHVTDLPIEMPKGINLQPSFNNQGLSINIKDLKYKYPSEPEYILKGINFNVNSSERICISGYSSSGKTTFINIILGFLTSYQGVVVFNNISLRNINKNSLINMIGDNVSQEDLFDGTLLENITLGRNNVKLEDVLWAIDCVGLSEFVQTQTDGLYMKLISGTMGISESMARKIIIARSIVMKPKLLILEDVLLGLEKEKKFKLLNNLTSKKFNWTLLIISNDENVMKICDKTVIMKEGKIVTEGTYEIVKQDIHFNELI